MFHIQIIEKFSQGKTKLESIVIFLLGYFESFPARVKEHLSPLLDARILAFLEIHDFFLQYKSP